MSDIHLLLEKNRQWQKKMLFGDPEFFRRLKNIQTPQYLWIGCADSRVPANQIIDLQPGEVFVHRNVANLAVHTDLNYLSVLQYAVDVLHIPHIIVCGHYNCGGVTAALSDKSFGLIDHWLHHIRDVYARFREELDSIPDLQDRANRLSELNVMVQCENIARTPIVRNAWEQGEKLTIYGFIYDVGDGLLKDLGIRFTNRELGSDG